MQTARREDLGDGRRRTSSYGTRSQASSPSMPNVPAASGPLQSEEDMPPMMKTATNAAAEMKKSTATAMTVIPAGANVRTRTPHAVNAPAAASTSARHADERDLWRTVRVGLSADSFDIVLPTCVVRDRYKVLEEMAVVPHPELIRHREEHIVRFLHRIIDSESPHQLLWRPSKCWPGTDDLAVERSGTIGLFVVPTEVPSIIITGDREHTPEDGNSPGRRHATSRARIAVAAELVSLLDVERAAVIRK